MEIFILKLKFDSTFHQTKVGVGLGHLVTY